MKLVLEFDLDADMIEVPQSVIDQRELLQKRFFKWLYNPQTRHNYWVTMRVSSGKTFTGVRYRSDAFVEWLNKKVLAKEAEKAYVIEEHLPQYSADIPKLQF